MKNFDFNEFLSAPSISHSQRDKNIKRKDPGATRSTLMRINFSKCPSRNVEIEGIVFVTDPRVNCDQFS